LLPPPPPPPPFPYTTLFRSPRLLAPLRLDALAIAVQHRFVLALEPATLDRAVHAALLKRAVLPPPAAGAWVFARSGGTRAGRARSEEHTSELQSRVDLVCRL